MPSTVSKICLGEAMPDRMTGAHGDKAISQVARLGKKQVKERRKYTMSKSDVRSGANSLQN